ncbi:hypothetical protein BD626DRAFT_463259 [Schizophyllum amplum]|uniref:DUF6697 domain-containing protein n=1 Tax=Schizophyllum amplum TaxID=97359 RepID=A0A550C1S5_9AGAR|nr:hypothetical protein BD626DRAFT_463259 [Auriculariopsis ampla]
MMDIKAANRSPKVTSNNKRQRSVQQRDAPEIIELDDSEGEQGKAASTSSVGKEQDDHAGRHLATPVSNVVSRLPTPSDTAPRSSTPETSVRRSDRQRRPTNRLVQSGILPYHTREEKDQKLELFDQVANEDNKGSVKNSTALPRSNKRKRIKQEDATDAPKLEGDDDDRGESTSSASTVKAEDDEPDFAHPATPVSDGADRPSTPLGVAPTVPGLRNRQGTKASRSRARGTSSTSPSATKEEEAPEELQLMLTTKEKDVNGREIEGFREVTLTKPEKGDVLWDLGPLNLGPVGDILEPVYQRVFKRTVLHYAFGGNLMKTFPNENRLPYYAAFNSLWNPQLPDRPGTHGIAFGEGACREELLPVFVSVPGNNWLYYGHYSTKLYGHLHPSQMARIPRSSLVEIAQDYVTKKWAQKKVDKRNEINKRQATKQRIPFRPILSTLDDMMAAFLDGRMVMMFAILEFAHYDTNWFRHLITAEKAGCRITPETFEEKKEKKTKEEEKKKQKKTKEQGIKSQALPPRKKRKTASRKEVTTKDESDSEVEFMGRGTSSSTGRALRSKTKSSIGQRQGSIADLVSDDDIDDSNNGLGSNDGSGEDIGSDNDMC